MKSIKISGKDLVQSRFEMSLRSDNAHSCLKKGRFV